MCAHPSSLPPPPPPDTAHDASPNAERLTWPVAIVALLIAVSSLTCAVLIIVLAPQHPEATAAAAGVIASTGITAAVSMTRQP